MWVYWINKNIDHFVFYGNQCNCWTTLWYWKINAYSKAKCVIQLLIVSGLVMKMHQYGLYSNIYNNTWKTYTADVNNCIRRKWFSFIKITFPAKNLRWTDSRLDTFSQRPHANILRHRLIKPASSHYRSWEIPLRKIEKNIWKYKTKYLIWV